MSSNAKISAKITHAKEPRNTIIFQKGQEIHGERLQVAISGLCKGSLILIDQSYSSFIPAA